MFFVSYLYIIRLDISFIPCVPPTIRIFSIQNVSKDSIFIYMLNTKLSIYCLFPNLNWSTWIKEVFYKFLETLLHFYNISVHFIFGGIYLLSERYCSFKYPERTYIILYAVDLYQSNWLCRTVSQECQRTSSKIRWFFCYFNGFLKFLTCYEYIP